MPKIKRAWNWAFHLVLALCLVFPGMALAQENALCAGYAREWNRTIASGSLKRIITERSRIRGLTGVCPDLWKRVQLWSRPSSTQQFGSASSTSPKQTVADFYKSQISEYDKRQKRESAVQLFTDRDPSKISSSELAPLIAEFIKNTEFRRNPTLATDRVGLYNEKVDVVASLEQNKAAFGDFRYSVSWNGAIWPFASQSNVEKFIADPDRYTTQYGGYCAFCMMSSHIRGGKIAATYKGSLYIFSEQSYLDDWLKNPTLYINDADKVWMSISLTELSPVGNGSFTADVLAALK